MNIKTVKALADILTSHNLSKLSITEGETRIYLEKSTPAAKDVFYPHVAEAPQAAQPETAAAPDFNNMTEVRSPIVGVFYAAPSPDAEPFVTIGSSVKKGDVLCIVEAMKLMNEITAECDGEVLDINVKNGDIVEFGQVLFKII